MDTGWEQRRKQKIEELRLMVKEDYKVLEKLFKAKYGDDKEIFGMPKFLYRLLPQKDGWCFSPKWLEPCRLERWHFAQTTGRGFHLNERYIPALGQHVNYRMVDLYDANNEIENRVKQHLWKHYSTDLILTAINQIRQCQSSSLKLTRNAEAQLWLDIRRTTEPTERDDKVLPALPEEVLQSLQLCLFKRWLKLERHRLADLQRVSRETISKERFAALIKPEEIFGVYQLYGGKKYTYDCLPILGVWYARQIYRCGADWRYLRAIRRKFSPLRKNRKRRSAVFGAGQRPPGAHAWAKIAQFKVRKHDNYKKKQL